MNAEFEQRALRQQLTKTHRLWQESCNDAFEKSKQLASLQAELSSLREVVRDCSLMVCTYASSDDSAERCYHESCASCHAYKALSPHESMREKVEKGG